MSLRTPHIDFIQGTAALPAWHMPIMAACLATSVVAVLPLLDILSTRDLLRASLAYTQDRHRQARPVVIPPQQLRALQEQIKTVNRQIQILNVPWGRVLRTMQPPSAIHVVILGLESTGQADTLRVSALADKPVDMTEYVAYLAEKRLLHDTYLIRHETVADGKLRFDVETAWRLNP